MMRKTSVRAEQGPSYAALDTPVVEGGTPLYAKIAQRLRDQIQSGALPVGSLLPKEIDLADSLGVSRQTVRQAIDQLRQTGMLSVKKGTGTRVEARNGAASYKFSLQTLNDIFQYASDTEFEPFEREEARVSGKLAAMLGSRPGRPLLRLAGVRHVIGDARPLCYSNVWVDCRCAHAIAGVDVFRSAIFSLIERKTGESITDVNQEIEAATAPPDIAARLQIGADTPCLQITRRYFARGRRFVEASISLYPADRFSYRIEFQRIR